MPIDLRLIDLLVDGELPEAARCELLSQLEREPEGWRRLALAFLEAQSWKQAFAQPQATRTEPEPLHPHAPTLSAKWPRGMLLAACLCGMFALGWFTRPSQESVPIREGYTRLLKPSDQEPVRPVSSPKLEPLDTVVQAYERQGYFAERNSRSVKMQLKDGRSLDFPVEEVRLRNVAGKTY
jgi:hypothetical protein